VPDVQTRRKLRSSETPASGVKTDWEHAESEVVAPVVLNEEYKNHHMSFFTKLFIFSAIFCIIAVGIGAYLFWNGANLISADNIDITISGPVSIPGGEPVTFDVTATNKNNVNLELVDMTVDFPAGTIDPSSPSQSLKTYRKMLGSMAAGKSIHDTIQATIFGEENLQKQIVVTLTYSVSGSTSVFTKSKSYDILINSSPINVTVSTFKEVTSGQEFDMKIDLRSNSQDVLKGIMLKATYPFGFKFISSTIDPRSDKSSWSMGDIAPGSKKSFTIHGSLTGENNDLRAFHFAVGAQSSKNSNSIGTQYMAVEQDVTIQKPFITLNIGIEGDNSSKDFVGHFGQSSNVTVKWFNNLSTIVSNMKIVVNLSGKAYDKTTVNSGSGYFDSRTDTITWSQQTNSELGSVGPGDSGEVSFSIIPRDLSTSQNPITSPTIAIASSVSGNRTQETNVPLEVTSTVARNILIPSTVSLSGRVVRTVGPFTNSGPIPPKADQTTTYTVVWDINNSSSAIGNTEVRATLPPYVKWLNSINPTSENITYDNNTGLVTWSVGTIGANTFGSSLRREASFQVALTPNITQLGSVPTLVNQTSLTAVDNFTNINLTSNQEALTTRYSTDPGYQQGNEMVGR
jgi:hypothetical protein